jgi:beta-lactam-binding protein with PASTA domain
MRKPPPCSPNNVQTLPLSTAKRYLTERLCKVGEITYAYAAHLKKGYVISQNPKARWQRANGAVDLVVSKGRR